MKELVMPTADDYIALAEKWVADAVIEQPTNPTGAGACAQISQAYTAIATLALRQRATSIGADHKRTDLGEF
jgi:hypothetical protein